MESTVSTGTPLSVVGGYLGAGKTTLVNHLLRRADHRRVAVLVNDFGSVDIDADLIEAADDDVISLTNGCVCCSLADGLTEAFALVRDRLDVVDHVVVEASGVADPMPIAHHGRAAGLSVRGIVVVVDAADVRRKADDRYVGDTVLRQLRAADLCVLNKADLIDDDDPVRQWLREAAPTAIQLECERGAVGWDVIEVLSPGLRHHTPKADHGQPHSARVIEYHGPVARGDLLSMVTELPADVVRVKGVVRLADDPHHAYAVHRAGGHVELVQLERPAPTTSTVVLITAGESPRHP